MSYLSKVTHGSFAVIVVLVATTLANAQSREDQIVRNSAAVLREVMAIPASQIPSRLMQEARGIAIIPGVVKGGFVVGIRHGRGVMNVRGENGQWLPPMFVSLTGGSVGWQAGIQSTDVILVFRTRKSINNLMNGKLTLGVDAAAAAGPVGRQASAATDATLSAEILSYSRSRGLFLGVSFDGSVLQVDQLAGMSYYQNHQVISPTGQATFTPGSLPPSAVELMNELARYTGAPASTGAAVPVPGATVPPVTATPAIPVTPAPAATSQQTEMVRQQLVTSWKKLSAMLPAEWIAYLELPPSVFTPGAAVSNEALNISLQRFAAISNHQQYLSLSQRPEFVTTHQLLREFATLNSATRANALTLPPPPANSAQAPQRRY